MQQNEFLILMSDQGHPISAMMAHIVAGLFILWVIALVWEGLVFKRVTGDPVVGKMSAAGVAWITLVLIGVATHFSIPGVIRDFNLPALLILFAFALWSGLKMREHIRLENEQG